MRLVVERRDNRNSVTFKFALGVVAEIMANG
jgi:hypothetical protein